MVNKKSAIMVGTVAILLAFAGIAAVAVASHDDNRVDVELYYMSEVSSLPEWNALKSAFEKEGFVHDTSGEYPHFNVKINNEMTCKEFCDYVIGIADSVVEKTWSMFAQDRPNPDDPISACTQWSLYING